MKNLITLIIILCVSLLSINAYAGKCACSFSRYSDNEGGVFKAKESLIFVVLIKPGSDVAVMVTKDASGPVMIVANSQGGITFMEITPVGGIVTTTIDLHGNAVHSRNTIIGGELIPSQYYGFCKCVAD